MKEIMVFLSCNVGKWLKAERRRFQTIKEGGQGLTCGSSKPSRRRISEDKLAIKFKPKREELRPI